MPKNEKSIKGKTSRRKAVQKEDAELYDLPKTSIKEFIKTERRHDELARLHEVREQNRVWRNTVFVCALFNVLLISLAVWGMYK